MMNYEKSEVNRYTFHSVSVANDTINHPSLQHFQVNSCNTFQHFPVYPNVLPTNYQPMSKFPVHHVSSPPSTQNSPKTSNIKWKINKKPSIKTQCFRLKPIAFNKSLSHETSLSSSPLSNRCNFPIVQDTQNNAETNSIYPSIEMKKYSTSAISTTRNYLTVYQYEINDQHIRWDYETGLVHLTGMWKASLAASSDPNVVNAALSSYNMKADIVKLLESTPKSFQPYIKRIRGGFLKIQGTWLPYSLAKMLAKKFCYHIRYKLVPIFGNDFPENCLKPNERGFGELKFDRISPTEELNLKESLSHLPKDTGTSADHSHERHKPRNLGPHRSKSDPHYNFTVAPTLNSSNIQKSLSVTEFPPPTVFPASRNDDHKEYLLIPYSNTGVQWAPLFHAPSASLIRKESQSQCPLESASPKTITLPLPQQQQQQQQQQLPPMSSLTADFINKTQLPPINTTTPYSPAESIMSNSHRTSLGSGDLTSETSPPTTTNNYEDMMDIVNACKCLQSFRIKNCINYTTKSVLHQKTRNLVPGITDPRNHDTTTNNNPLPDNCTASLPPIVELYATKYSRLSNARHHTPKPPSLSVNDLLT